MDEERFSYYVVFIFRDLSGELSFGCRDVDLTEPLENPERRKRLATEWSIEFPHVVITYWRRNE